MEPAAITKKSESCTSVTCRLDCALGVIDGLLRDSSAVRGEDVDMLLDLRWLLRKREHAQEALLLFCSLRRALEEKHYLAFYRLRRWLENHLRVSIRPRRDHPMQIVPLKLNRYCLEAISFQCLQAVPAELRPLLLAPKVEFSFRAEPSQDALTASDASDCGYSATPLNPS